MRAESPERFSPGESGAVAMPHRNYQSGETVYIRATVLQACSDAFQVRIEDYPNLTITTWAPVSEIAKPEDIARLRPVRRSDLNYLDSHHARMETSASAYWRRRLLALSNVKAASSLIGWRGFEFISEAARLQCVPDRYRRRPNCHSSNLILMQKIFIFGRCWCGLGRPIRGGLSSPILPSTSLTASREGSTLS
jgi:hypothetical protein